MARVVVGQSLGLAELRRWATGVPLVPADGRPGLATDIHPPPGGPAAPGCWRFGLPPDPTWALPTGADLLEQWRRMFDEPEGAAATLLAPVVSAGAAVVPDGSGARESGPELSLCVSRPTPDLPRRLAHPALWLSAGGPAGGPFVESADDPRRFPRNPRDTAPPPLDAVRAVEGHDPSLLLRLGEADAALLYGPSAAALIERPTEALRVERWPAMDRVYWIRFHLGGRWVRDPTFRRWLADRLPRESILRYVIDERGETTYTLSPQAAPGPHWDPVTRRPFDTLTHPQLSLDYPDRDRLAAAIARRLQAALELEGLSVALRERPLEELTAEGFDGPASMALLCHRPHSEDPVLALLETLGRLGPRAAPVLALLEEGSRLEDEADRRAAAWLAEDGLLLEADVAPVVRVGAWLASRRTLRGLVAGAGGMPRFDLAWWEQ